MMLEYFFAEQHFSFPLRKTPAWKDKRTYFKIVLGPTHIDILNKIQYQNCVHLAMGGWTL